MNALHHRSIRIFLSAFALLLAFALAGEAAAVDFSVHGYFRNRVVGTQDLDLQKSRNVPASAGNNNRFGFISYNQMRLRIDPNLKIGNNLAIHGTFDILDNVLFGSRETRELNIIAPVVGPQTLPPGAGSFYMTGPNTVGENGAINVRRIWAEVFTPVGQFRFGRMPSNWGLGIFQNDGNELQGDFGDTADRIMYLLQYSLEGEGSITGGLLWDIAFEAQVDPRIDGLTTAPASNGRDTQQYAALFLYEQPSVTAGVFGGLRRRNGPDGATTMTVTDALGNEVAAGIDGDTMLYFADLYARYQWENYTFEIEGLYLGGKVSTGLALDAIPFSGLGAGEGIIQLPRNQSMQVFEAAFEAKAEYKFGGAWNLKAGYAPGDKAPLSNKISQLGFRPDYQIALMMFHMPLGTTPSLYGQKAGGSGGTEYLAGGMPVTGNYINNALYFSAGYKHKFTFKTGFADWISVGGQVTTAWAPRKITNINFQDLIPQPGNWPALTDTANSIWKRWYGVEVDISAEAMLFKNFYTALQGGIIIPGRAYDVDVQLFDPGSIVEPIPRDKANIGWLMRLSAILLF